MATEYFFFLDGHEIGPISYAELLACIRRREITGSTMVRYGKREPRAAMRLLREELDSQSRRTGWKALVAIVVTVPLVAIVGHLLSDDSAVPLDSIVVRIERPADAPTEDMTDAAGRSRGREDTLRVEAQQPTEYKIDHARLAELETGVVYISVNDQKAGSGFLVEGGETIATNAHVIQGARTVTVQFQDGSSCASDGWRAFDPSVDLAIISVTRAPFGTSAFALADALPYKGEDVHADGAPLGLKWTLTKGAVSGIRTGADVNSFIKRTEFNAGSSWIQHTAAIDHGSSGGPLIDPFGQVIGVNTLSCPGEVGPRVFFASSSENLRELIRTMSPSPRDYAELQRSPARSVSTPQLNPSDRSETLRIMTIMKSLLNERTLLSTQEKLLIKRIAALKAKRDEFRGGDRLPYTRKIDQDEYELDGIRIKRRDVEENIQSWAEKYPELMGQ